MSSTVEKDRQVSINAWKTSGTFLDFPKDLEWTTLNLSALDQNELLQSVQQKETL